MKHHKEMGEAVSGAVERIDEESVKRMLRCWVKAQGGAKKAAERIMPVSKPLKDYLMSCKGRD